MWLSRGRVLAMTERCNGGGLWLMVRAGQRQRLSRRSAWDDSWADSAAGRARRGSRCDAATGATGRSLRAVADRSRGGEQRWRSRHQRTAGSLMRGWPAAPNGTRPQRKPSRLCTRRRAEQMPAPTHSPSPGPPRHGRRNGPGCLAVRAPRRPALPATRSPPHHEDSAVWRNPKPARLRICSSLDAVWLDPAVVAQRLSWLPDRLARRLHHT